VDVELGRQGRAGDRGVPGPFGGRDLVVVVGVDGPAVLAGDELGGVEHRRHTYPVGGEGEALVLVDREGLPRRVGAGRGGRRYHHAEHGGRAECANEP
jgi:hypothetical protein